MAFIVYYSIMDSRVTYREKSIAVALINSGGSALNTAAKLTPVRGNGNSLCLFKVKISTGQTRNVFIKRYDFFNKSLNNSDLRGIE